MRPQPFAFIPGSTARVVWNDDDRLMARMVSHFSSGNSSIGATCGIPALLTRIFTVPNVAVAFSTNPAISSGLVISAPQYDARTRCSVSMAVRNPSMASSSPKPLSIKLQPAPARAWAMASPIPLVEPVTIADLPVSMPCLLKWRPGDRGSRLEGSCHSREAAVSAPD